MANITLTFTDEIPFGVQIRDAAWYLDNSEAIEVEMGPITAISGNQITVDAAAGVQPPGTEDFVFYVKNPMTYMGQLKGYYAEMQFINDSTEYA